MTASASPTLTRAAAPALIGDADQRRAWFAFALPAVMAVLLALVPLIGRAAAVPFLLVLVPLVLWSAFRDTERALYVYIAWCWMDGTIRGLFDSNPVAIVARDIVLGVIVVGWGLQRLQSRGVDPIRWPPGSLLVGLFVVNCLLQVANPYSPGLVQSIGGLKLHLAALPLLFVAHDVFRRPAQVRALLLFLTLATLVTGLVSLVQYVGGKEWTWAHFPGTKEIIAQASHATTAGKQIAEIATFRPPGTTSGGGGEGAYAGYVFPLSFSLIMLSSRLAFSKRVRACLLAILMAFFIIMLINSIRSALVSAIIGVLLCGLLIGGRLRARMLKPVLMCIGLALIAWTFSERLSQGGVSDRFSSTLSSPVNSLHEDRRTFFDDMGGIVTHAPMGVGLGRIGAAAARLGSSNSDLGFTPFTESYLGDIIFETGLLGGILITAVAVFFTLRGYSLMSGLQAPDEKFLAVAIVAFLAVILGNFFVSPILLGPPNSVLFWLLSGALLRAFAVPVLATARRAGG